jgi:hypothetical protein
MKAVAILAAILIVVVAIVVLKRRPQEEGSGFEPEWTARRMLLVVVSGNEVHGSGPPGAPRHSADVRGRRLRAEWGIRWLGNAGREMTDSWKPRTGHEP